MGHPTYTPYSAELTLHTFTICLPLAMNLHRWLVKTHEIWKSSLGRR